jgi:beta-glucanase (GH16 family)
VTAIPIYWGGGNLQCSTAPYKLIFHDEFNGTSLDVTKWYRFYPYASNYSDNCSFCRTHGDGEDQIYRDQNVTVSNGTVKLTAKKESGTWMGLSRNHTSGMIHSKENFNFKFGKYEIRCKIPKGKGFWPAFWLFGSDREIDVFEFFSKVDEFDISSHIWCNGTAATKTSGFSFSDLSLDFHTYTMEWTPHNLNFFIDGNYLWSIRRLINTAGQEMNVDCGNYLAAGTYLSSKFVPQGNMSLIANLAIYAQSDSRHPDATTPFPSNFEIDFIRVWQREIGSGFTDLCNELISGNDVICTGQNASFNLIENMGTVNWTVSSNLDIISSTNTSITVRAKSYVVNGDAWVKSTYSSATLCGTTSTTKNFWIGKPNDIAVIEHAYPCDNCFSIDAYCATNSKAVFSWDVGNGQYNNYDCAPSASFFIPYSVTATNTCGTQSASGTIMSPYCDGNYYRGGQSILITPNPVNSIAQITLNNIPIGDITQILILNKNGGLVKRITGRFENIFELDVSTYQNGIYGIIVNLKGKTLSISASFTVQH